MVRTVPGEKGFKRLEEAIAAGDLDEGFEAAHALKGVFANLSLTPLTQIAGEIIELLRAKTQTDYTPLLEQLEAKRAELEALCKE